MTCIDGLAHIQIDSKTDWNDGGKEDKEAEDVDVPSPPEAVQRYQDDRQYECDNAKDLKDRLSAMLEHTGGLTYLR